MATSAEYMDFVIEQLQGFGAIRYKKMFGEYMVYINDKPVITVCDNTVFVKKLPEIAELMINADCGFPYEGAKEHYIFDVENHELAAGLIPMLERLTPMPKPRKKKIKQ